jgi:hypothetical protein
MTFNPRRMVRGILAVAVGATVAAAWPVVPVSAAPKPIPPPPFTRTEEPADPEHPPTGPPAIDLTAACVRSVDGGQLEAVFGYDSHAPASVFVPLAPDLPIPDSSHPNVIVRMRDDGAIGIQDLGPQVTLFKPGPHPYAFAVRFTTQEEVAWQVNVPADDESGTWTVTVYPHLNARCASGVPDHFAVVQQFDQRIPQPANFVFTGDPAHIVAYDIRQGVNTVRIACSSGGEPLQPIVRFGWPVGMNVGPVRVDYRVNVVLSGGTVTYEMTEASARPVADILQEVRWLGPIADVTGRCSFGNKVLKSDVFWSEVVGDGFLIPDIVDGLMVGISGSQNAPLGTRLR